MIYIIIKKDAKVLQLYNFNISLDITNKRFVFLGAFDSCIVSFDNFLALVEFPSQNIYDLLSLIQKLKGESK